MPRSRTRIGLIALELFVAATAIGGGIALAAGLEGGRFPRAWLVGTPFADYVVPGLILAVVVGGSAAAAAVGLVRQSRFGARVALLAGMALTGWIVGEIAIVRADNELVSPIEAAYGLAGLASVWLAVRLGGVAGARGTSDVPVPGGDPRL